LHAVTWRVQKAAMAIVRRDDAAVKIKITAAMYRSASCSSENTAAGHGRIFDMPRIRPGGRWDTATDAPARSAPRAQTSRAQPAVRKSRELEKPPPAKPPPLKVQPGQLVAWSSGPTDPYVRICLGQRQVGQMRQFPSSTGGWTWCVGDARGVADTRAQALEAVAVAWAERR
jgi:hypothetical protein